MATGEPESDDDEDAPATDTDKGGVDAILRDVHYQFKCQLMERGRNLRATWM